MARARKILLVDDDELLRETLLDQFGHHDEFAVEAQATAPISYGRSCRPT